MTGEAAFAASLGAGLRSLRTKLGLRQDDVARRARSAGVTWARSSVAALESGARNLSAFEWLLLPRIYGCTPDDLLRLVDLQAIRSDAAPDETDRKVAARLDMPPEEVASLAIELWGRSVGEERDARAGVSGSARSVQAVRGHVTRTLVAELAAVVRTKRSEH
ncbi:helix-turn-helix transcriptional regulator [Streptomyces sp900116325]|uniref:helix-turn-helix transcriptional regulator n=1 Tax=Streptomyces sp. 900116325 TaxID=3154295 RepID=UPI0033B5C6B3